MRNWMENWVQAAESDPRKYGHQQELLFEVWIVGSG